VVVVVYVRGGGDRVCERKDMRETEKQRERESAREREREKTMGVVAGMVVCEK
jgi:hypothetical protein